MSTEQRLPGGYVTAVVRVGDTVRRAVPAPGGLAPALLRHLEACRWPGAPRHLGVDDQGRETLTYLSGHVAWAPVQPAAVRCDESLVAVARLVRELHDLTAGTALATGHEVVCHNDLAPKNTVYRDAGQGLRPVAFIDWDLAAPGERVHDVAHVCWQYTGLGPGADGTAVARRARLVADAYGLPDRAALVPAILWWQERCARGIEAAADAGDPAMARLRALGAVAEVRAAHAWTAGHRDTLDRALR